MAKKILFVCTGNTCRSPMAEGLLKKIAKDNQLPVEVQSAGLAAFSGVAAAPEAVQACQEKGVDISAHQSQPLGKTLVMESDLILTMTGKHKEMIVKKMPALEPKVALFSEFAGAGTQDIEDPVGQTIETYRKVLGQMEEYLQKSLDKFKN
ncbi:MAG TPA: low molecular weight protein arginine phosphatase [bacterium]|nr:low molecular weight protein arginine phosphatase [bacterium]